MQTQKHTKLTFSSPFVAKLYAFKITAFKPSIYTDEYMQDALEPTSGSLFQPTQ